MPRRARGVEVSVAMALVTLLGGTLAGLSLGLLGVGGSILIVPLLVYGLHLPPHLAIGTSTVAATASALWSLGIHARAGTVRWRQGGTYALASVLGAASGARLGRATDSHLLLALLGALMVLLAALMVRGALRRSAAASRAPSDRSGARLAALAAAGFGVGSLAGLVGVGGGFLTVPALTFLAGLPLLSAVGTSLISVGAVAGTTAVSYASAHLVAWPIAGLLMAGGMLGGYAGVRLAGVLGARKRALTLLFSAVVAAAGLYMMAQALR